MNNRPTILLVEDDPTLLSILSIFFESRDFDVMTTSDGREAVELYCAHSGKIDIVLADMGLPSLGGWDMCKEIMTFDPGAKVLLASGFYDSSIRDELIEIGAQDFIQKPYDPPKILDLIQQILASDPA